MSYILPGIDAGGGAISRLVCSLGIYMVTQRWLEFQADAVGVEFCCWASRYDSITPLFIQLHWLKVPERIEFLSNTAELSGVRIDAENRKLNSRIQHRLRGATGNASQRV